MSLPRQKKILRLKLLKEKKRRDCINSLDAFTQEMWPVIEPSTQYRHGWHIEIISRHLESVARFEIPKLIINIPPRHMKSILASVMFPAWVWLKNPERRFIYASYAQALATRDSVKTRTLIESPEYQSLFKPDWSLSSDENQKTLFSNTRSGVRLSIGVGGGITGQGGDFIFVDDPVNALDAHSEVTREEANRWHDTVLSSRINDPQRNAKVIIMQRLHESDLTGHVLKKEGRYESLILQAKYNPDSEIKSKTSLNFLDPRKIKGQLLWPERFDDQSIKDLETDLGDDAEAQLQQDPRPRAGGLFPRDHWQEFDGIPSEILEYVQFIDAAQKPGITNDYSVIATWVRTKSGFYLLDLWRDKVDMPSLEVLTKTYFDKWKPNAVVIEDKSGGSSLIQYLRRFTTIPVIAYSPDFGDKELRATSATPTVKAGKCFLPKGSTWVKDFKDEHEKFPKGAHDDQVDTTSMMVDYWGRRMGVEPRIRQL